MFTLPTVSTELINVSLASVLLLVSLCQYFLVWEDSLGMMRVFLVMTLVTVLKSLLDEVLSTAVGVWISLMVAMLIGVVLYKVLKFSKDVIVLICTFIISLGIGAVVKDPQLKVLLIQTTWFVSMGLWFFLESKNGYRKQLLNLLISFLCSTTIVYTITFFLSRNFHHFGALNDDLYSVSHCFDKNNRCRLDILLVYTLLGVRLVALFLVARRRNARASKKEQVADEQLALALAEEKRQVDEQTLLLTQQRDRNRHTNAQKAFVLSL